MSFESFTKLIPANAPVLSSVVNDPIASIDANTRYLYELLQAAGIGSTVFARRRTVNESVTVGSPVFYNSQTQQFEPGLALAETDAVTGLFVTSPSANIWGIVHTKFNPTLADILLFGLSEVDLTAAIDGPLVSGTYYLSGRLPGKLTSVKPSMAIPVLRHTGAGQVFVNPSWTDAVDQHQHHKFYLNILPAGKHNPPVTDNNPATDELHVITEPDNALQGWLPADDAIFEGKAPVGAQFGYNISADARLKEVWPPVPLASAHVEITLQGPGSRSFSFTVADEFVQITSDGIWWMTACRNSVPWNVDLLIDDVFPRPVYDPTPEVPETCPPAVKRRLILWFTKVNFATDTTTVTSLRSTDSRLKVLCRGTERNGFVGDLDLDIDLDLMVGVQNLGGSLAVKRFADNKLDFGRVTEGVYTTSPNVLLAGDHSQRLNPQDSSSPMLHQGRVNITVVDTATSQIQPQVIRLLGATEEYSPILYLGLRPDVETAFVATFDVPITAPAQSQLELQLLLLARTTGTLPQLLITRTKISRPSGNTSTTAAVSPVAITLNTVVTTTNTMQLVALTAAPFAVAPGDIVFIEIRRDPSSVSDNYASELGVVQQVCRLSIAAP